MNDEAREVLVQAALAGKVQVKGAIHATPGEENPNYSQVPWQVQGNCVLGELHVAYHQGSEAEARACVGGPQLWLMACIEQVYQRFGIASSECACPICHYTLPTEAILLAEHLNDLHGLSFLDIARKAP